MKVPPYEVQESGFGSFDMVVDVYFRNKDEPRMVRYTYDLILPSPEQKAIHAPRHEMLTFQNPPLEFCQKLILAGGVIKSGPDPKQILSAIPPTSGSSTGAKRSRKASEAEAKDTKQKQTKLEPGATETGEPPKKIKKEEKISDPGQNQSSGGTPKQEKGSGTATDKKRRQLPSGKDPVSALIAEYASEEDSSDSDLDFGTSFKSKHSSLAMKTPKQVSTSGKGVTSGNSSDTKRKVAEATDDVKEKKKEKEEARSSSTPMSRSSKRMAGSTGREKVSEKEKTPEAAGAKAKRETKQKSIQKEKGVDAKSGQRSSQAEKDSGLSGVKEREEKKSLSKENPSDVHDAVEQKETKQRASPMRPARDKKKEQGGSKPSNNKPTDGPTGESDSSSESGNVGDTRTGHQENGKSQANEMEAPASLSSSELQELHNQLNSLQDKEVLQKIVDLVEPTGKFALNDKTFDFDLLEMDDSLLHKLKSLVVN